MKRNSIILLALFCILVGLGITGIVVGCILKSRRKYITLIPSKKKKTTSGFDYDPRDADPNVFELGEMGTDDKQFSGAKNDTLLAKDKEEDKEISDILEDIEIVVEEDSDE